MFLMFLMLGLNDLKLLREPISTKVLKTEGKNIRLVFFVCVRWDVFVFVKLVLPFFFFLLDY